MSRALVFDCDGVLADTERFGHLPAFNQMFAEFGLPVHWSEEEYGRKLKIGGGKERMASLLTPEFVAAANLPTDIDEQRACREGVRRLVGEAAEAGWRLAVASTSAEPSVKAVLDRVVGPATAAGFLVFAGDVVPHKKPAPDIYLLALEHLGLPGSDAVVIEDSGNGLDAARSAGITCLVTVNEYTRDDDFDAAALVVSSLGDPGGERTQVLANASGVPVGDWVSMETVEALVS